MPPIPMQGAMVAGINVGGGLGNLLAGSKLPPIHDWYLRVKEFKSFN